MSGMHEDELQAKLRSEAAGWHPPRGADLRDLMQRVERDAMRPVFRVSLFASAALGVVLLACVLIVSVPSLFPGADAVRAHLLGVQSVR